MYLVTWDIHWEKSGYKKSVKVELLYLNGSQVYL